MLVKNQKHQNKMFKLGFPQTLGEKSWKVKKFDYKINGYAIKVQEKLIVKTLYSSPFTTIILLFVNYKRQVKFCAEPPYLVVLYCENI